jgi:choline kinase
VTGVVLAAGPGRRLLPLTAELPKTLLPLGDGRTILDVALGNLGGVGIERVIIVTGVAATQVEERVPELERRHGLQLELLFNDRAEDWNNAYSLWLARAAFADGVLLTNGDTVHPRSVEESLLRARGPALVLALDERKPLGEEEMKVVVTDGQVRQIDKRVPPEAASGEYIGVALIEPAAAEPLAAALETAWKRDPALYYEDGFADFARQGGDIGVAPIGDVEWVEVDTPADLERAREIECRS